MAGDSKMEGVAPSHANPSSPSLAELLQRVEAASGPDQELDRALAVRLIGWCLHPRDRQRDDSAQSDTGWTCLDCGADSWGNTGPTGQRRHATVPALTASIDAALALVARTCPEAEYDICRRRGTQRWHVLWWVTASAYWLTFEGATAPLAILAALLKALIASEGTLDGSSPPNPTLEVKP